MSSTMIMITIIIIQNKTIIRSELSKKHYYLKETTKKLAEKILHKNLCNFAAAAAAKKRKKSKLK